MTFLEIRQRIAEIIGEDSTDTTADNNGDIETKLKKWVNARYRLVCGRRSWNWLMKDAIIQTATQITTGTVSATNGSTSITFSSAPSVSVANWFIQFSDSDDWYEVSNHTASSTSATLANAYLGTTSSTLTYTLRQVYYTLPSDTGKIYDLRQTRQDDKLRFVPQRLLDRVVPDRTRTGKPNYYTLSGQDANQLFKVELYPIPDVAMNINVRYLQVPAELSADADVPVIPTPFHDFLVWDVLGSYGFIWLDDTRVSAAKAEANSIFQAMVDGDAAAENLAQRLPFDIDLGDKDWILHRLDLPIQ